MRKSVEQRARTKHRGARHGWGFFGYIRKHLWVFATITVLLFAELGVLYTMTTRAAAEEQTKQAAHSKEIAKIDATIARLTAERKKLEAARKAEAEAKAKAEAEEAARKAAAASQPSGTATARSCDVTNPAAITVVVNKKHCFSPISWAPSDLASVNGYLLRAEAANQMLAMMNAAAAAGVGFSLSSAYRSYSDQVTTYNNWVAVNGSQAAADTVSARPGYSEHQTGLAADLKVGSCALECFKGTAQYTWLTEHAAEYGFIQRYPDGLTSITGYSPEAWHWRYVGVSTATDMKAKGIQTLEQYFGVSGGDY